MTKTEFLKKLKAGLLAGTMAATLSACGEEPEKEKESTTTAIVTEDTTEETKTTTVEGTANESKKAKENATNKEEKTENNTEVVENPTKGENKETKPNNTTSNNATPTSEETKENTPSNTTKNNTTPVVTQRTQTPVTTKATQKVTTKTTPTTTKAVQTQAPTTTAAPIVTTVATIPYRERSYTKDDMKSNDENIASYAMSQLSTELAGELFNGCVGPRTFSGEEEATAIIIALNSNQSLNRNMIGNCYLYDTNEEFNELCDIQDIAYYQYRYNSNVDFSKYVLDDEFAEFINNICEKYIEYMSGNTGTLSSEIDNYFSNNSVNIDNCIEYYFMCKTKESLGIDTPELENAKQLYYDEVLSPLYSEFETSRHFIYTR